MNRRVEAVGCFNLAGEKILGMVCHYMEGGIMQSGRCGRRV